MYLPLRGDVVTINGEEEPMVVIYIDNREDLGAVCYDRTYYLIKIEELISSEEFLIEKEKLLEMCIEVNVVGTIQMPTFAKVDTAPYEIKDVNCMNVRKKKAKTITVYE